MLDRLDNEFSAQQKTLDLLNKRQNILASNIANADTPGYLARDIDFSSQLKNVLHQTNTMQRPLALNVTSSAHITAGLPSTENTDILYRIPDQPGADNNTVDMDRERASFADNNIKYQTSLTALSAQIKNLSSVLNPG